MPRYALIWMPEGRLIVHVDAPNERAARRQAPRPYARYLGEIAVIPVDPPLPAPPDPEDTDVLAAVQDARNRAATPALNDRDETPEDREIDDRPRTS
jgi:hypothetical protein